jgi:osmoprotectant transport system permease protein
MTVTKSLAWAFLLVGVSTVKLNAQATVAAKSSTEGHVLGEIVAQLLEFKSARGVTRKLGMGGTSILFGALTEGAIDVYPEYSGTIEYVVAKQRFDRFDDLRSFMRDRHEIHVSQPLGFSNSYTVAMNSSQARELRISKISDLQHHPDLKWGVTHEFLNREDGLPALLRHYGLRNDKVVGIEKSVAYQAVDQGKIDLTDAYSTDGQLLNYDMTILNDDRDFFPEYQAVLLCRDAALRQFPELKAVLAHLEGQIDQHAMQELNAMVDVEKKSPAEAARTFVGGLGLGIPAPGVTSDWSNVLASLLQHIKLTAISLCLSTCIGISLALLIFWFGWMSSLVLNSVGVMQTIPSIGLLAVMIPIFGIGMTPAIVALTLYGLLPIVQNTYAGIVGVPAAMIDAARGVGLSRWETLRLIRIPLAMRFIVAGIKTSAVINVGAATLAALVGAGGLGDYILAGLSLNNGYIMLKGIVPAALLAIGVEKLFGALELWVTPEGMTAE